MISLKVFAEIDSGLQVCKRYILSLSYNLSRDDVII